MRPLSSLQLICILLVFEIVTISFFVKLLYSVTNVEACVSKTPLEQFSRGIINTRDVQRRYFCEMEAKSGKIFLPM